MEQSILSSLLDFGALGLFAGSLVWQHIKSQQRLEATVEQFQQTVRNQEAAHQAAEDLIRTRYDAIIARHESQRQTVYEDVVKKLDNHSRLLADIHEVIRASSPSRFIDPTITIPER